MGTGLAVGPADAAPNGVAREAGRAAAVALEGVGKAYENGAVAVHDVSLAVAPGEFVVLVGPSGCGKSTTLRMVAGLEAVTAGRVLIGGRVVNDVPPAERDVAMVFQTYALYPHMTVRENMAFALRLRKRPKAEVDARVARAAETLALTPLLDRMPRQLSGGQRQRVAIGRAIVREPRLFLFDEPLSNLDARLRGEMRREIAALHRRLGATMLYVTHDQVEAMTLGDRIVVMRAGRVEQVGAPGELYAQPATAFVAGFIGSPPMNLLGGRVDGPAFRAGDDTPPAFGVPPALAAAAGRAVLLGVRPEHVRLATDAPEDWPATEFRVELVEPLGHEVLVHARRGPWAVTARARPGAAVPPAGDAAALAFDPRELHLFDAESGALVARGADGPADARPARAADALGAGATGSVAAPNAR